MRRPEIALPGRNKHSGRYGIRKETMLPGFLLACVVMWSFACSTDTDPITIRIFSYGSNYTGTYILNGGESKVLDSGSDKSTVYFGEFTLEDVDQVEVDVTTITKDASSLAVKIYRDDEKVKESVVLDSGAGIELTVNITYTYGEETESDE